MTQQEIQVLKSLSANLNGDETESPPLTLAQYNAVALALREKGLLGIQAETLHNDWTDQDQIIVNAIWLTAEGRQVVRGL